MRDESSRELESRDTDKKTCKGQGWREMEIVQKRKKISKKTRLGVGNETRIDREKAPFPIYGSTVRKGLTSRRPHPNAHPFK
jgi:hypothetical protein